MNKCLLLSVSYIVYYIVNNVFSSLNKNWQAIARTDKLFYGYTVMGNKINVHHMKETSSYNMFFNCHKLWCRRIFLLSRTNHFDWINENNLVPSLFHQKKNVEWNNTYFWNLEIFSIFHTLTTIFPLIIAYIIILTGSKYMEFCLIAVVNTIILT